MTSPRIIPSIETVLQRPGLSASIAHAGHDAVARAAREAADELRGFLGSAEPGSKTPEAPRLPTDADQAAAWLEARTLAVLEAWTRPSLVRVINATGVILHTNLGRAPLAAAALDAAAGVAGGYANLEYELESGARGHRHVHAERLLCRLTGAEAALVANNNAAATLLVLAALASGREVIVSRGELVEIGGGFRVPDVMAQSGASLREVGTTNRTRVADYAAAIGDRTGLLLRVHPSNFRIEGFAERAPLADLSALARRFELPLFEDLGSGWLGLDDVIAPAAFADEPSVIESLRAGADLVAFSGDKLLGGPQAGIVVGRKALIDRARRHPLMRAVRADKLTYGSLEATLRLWADAGRRAEIPAYRMMTMTVDAIDDRARRIVAALDSVTALTCTIVDGESTIGGGSAPQATMPTRLIAITCSDSAERLAEWLRCSRPPIVSRIDDNRVVLDLRTVAPDDDLTVADVLSRIS